MRRPKSAQSSGCSSKSLPAMLDSAKQVGAPNHVQQIAFCHTYSTLRAAAPSGSLPCWIGTKRVDVPTCVLPIGCSSQWLPAMLDRCSRMYERDKNHPCITLWSLGNECGYGPAHDAMAAMLRAKDPSRPVQYECLVKGPGFIFSHPLGPTTQPPAAKGQGSLFDKGCSEAKGFGAAQHGGGGS
eukprot:1160534-Pelagomonas_calceolata.AAC.15